MYQRKAAEVTKQLRNRIEQLKIRQGLKTGTRDESPESDSYCEICETTGHDILTCTNMFGKNFRPKEIRIGPLLHHAHSDEIKQASKSQGQSPEPDVSQNSGTQHLGRGTDGFLVDGTGNRMYDVLAAEHLQFRPEECLEDQSTLTHQVYKSKVDIPWEHVDYLGKGAFGWVEKVKWKHPSSETHLYARKTIQSFGWNASQELASIQNEVSIIQKLRHRHIVRLVSTYQVEKQFCLVMLPVAQCHLGEHLEMLSNTGIGINNAAGDRLIWKWYGCLAQALKYIHKQRIRHK
jgi:hypothetical protein